MKASDSILQSKWPKTPILIFMLLVLVSGTAVAEIPTDYISWWKFEGDANDETGTNNGTLTNGASTAYNSERQGQVLVLDGLDDYVDVGNFDIVGSGLTISAWFSSDILIDQARIITKSTSSLEQDHYWMLGPYNAVLLELIPKPSFSALPVP